MNYLTEARGIVLSGVNNHTHFPKEMVSEAIAIVYSHFSIMGKEIAAIELAWKRSQMLYSDEKEKLLSDFNNHLAIYQDILTSELKVEWNELFEKLR